MSGVIPRNPIASISPAEYTSQSHERFSMLSTILRPCEHSSPPRAIWADGVCINQDDIEERQQQVSIMGIIYHTAIRVISYMGPEPDDSSLAIDFAHQLLEFADRKEHGSDPRLHIEDQIHTLGLPPISDPCWQALKSLLLRGWSSRCWCAHEFVMNRKTVVMCGRQQFADEYVLANVVMLAVHRLLPVFTVPSSEDDTTSLRECIWQMAVLRNQITVKNESIDSLYLLKSGHAFQASDPRDKVYSVLGFARDRHQYNIHVDYTSTIASLYTAIAIQSIRCNFPIDDLLSANLSKKSQSLPSWVPDWSTWRDGAHGDSSTFNYTACGNGKAEINVDDVNLKLSAVGCTVDKLSWVDNVSLGAMFHLPIIQGRKEWLLKMESEVIEMERYADSEKRDVLWRTLIGNNTHLGMPGLESYRMYYDYQLYLTEASPQEEQKLGREFCDSARRTSRHRRLGKTEMGYFGAVVETAQAGDFICMLEGSRTLHTLRLSGSDYLLIGPAYIHGLMYGEVFQMDSYSRCTITLV